MGDDGLLHIKDTDFAPNGEAADESAPEEASAGQGQAEPNAAADGVWARLLSCITNSKSGYTSGPSQIRGDFDVD